MSKAGWSENGRNWLGLACATGAVALGLAYMAAAGAPMRLLAMNVAAWVTGLAAFATIVLPRWQVERWRRWALPGLAAALLATLWLGEPVEGATRWIGIGPLVLQPSLIIVPAMLLWYARAPGAAGAAAIALSATALALQPDCGMAGALLAGSAMVLVRHRSTATMLACLAAAAGFALTLVRPDTLPASPFVDGIFYSAFEVHILAGAAVLAGAVLMLVPAMGAGQDSIDLDRRAVFAATWLAIMLAAALGNYPTPVVGYGGSAIAGYLLSLALLSPARGAASAGQGASRAGSRDDGRTLFVSPA